MKTVPQVCTQFSLSLFNMGPNSNVTSSSKLCYDSFWKLRSSEVYIQVLQNFQSKIWKIGALWISQMH